ncbi:MAG: bifunctional folylpolyglutamate synthase/dihydrofolate synthase [Lentisphaeria bacterium]|nr:bifunctional folylpolyglutamate synthase/dihydrofolate synthase [Lentisphaeria bacterium]
MKEDTCAGFDGDAYISGLNMFGIRLGLDNVRKLFSAAGDPQKKLRFIHIAGTNGKGSTGAMLECALRNAGLKTGFYSSPHLIDIRERFRIDGRAADRKTFDAAVRELAEKSKGLPATYFEFTTVLAAMLFEAAHCDIVVWETGMGGRLDATNAVLPAVTVITNIALDHQKHLGSTLAAIAGEKAGILKPGVPLFHGELVPEAKRVILARAGELDVPVTGPGDEVPPCLKSVESPCGFVQKFLWRGKKIELGLPGRMQRENFRIVFNVLAYLAQKLHFDFDRALASLDHVRWPARLDKIEERVFVDGGHNPDGIRALTESLRELLPGEKFTVVYGAFKDKDASGCLPLYRDIAAEFIMIPNAETGRECHPPEELAAAARALGFAARTAPSGSEAVELALASSSRRVLVSGSLFLAGEILAARGKLDHALDLR